jgi:hypothetical protein
MPDPREPCGRIFHEQGRLTVNAEREKPFHVEDWDRRTSEQREIDMRGASAVAARAVSDAKLEAAAMRKRLLALSIHFPAIRDALTRAAADAEYDTQARPFRAALGALEGTGAPERGDGKEPAP